MWDIVYDLQQTTSRDEEQGSFGDFFDGDEKMKRIEVESPASIFKKTGMSFLTTQQYFQVEFEGGSRPMNCNFFFYQQYPFSRGKG